jgi:uncharacterized protein (DUF1778 family)
LQSAESAAARAIQERTMMVLSARESEAFVEKLLTPSALGRALRDAAKRYKKRLGAE